MPLEPGRRPRILFLAHLLPWPLVGGGQIKSYHTLRILSLSYEVTLLAFIRRAEEAQFVDSLRPFCKGGIHVVRLPRGPLRDSGAALLSLLRHESFFMIRDRYSGMIVKARELLGDPDAPHPRFDAIHVDHLQMMSYIRDLPTRTMRVVLDNHNVEFRIPKRLSETPGGNPVFRAFLRGEWPKLRAFERRACRDADHVLAVSKEDAAELTALDPEALTGKISVVPIGVDLDYWGSVRPDPGAMGILSIGTMYWPPNVDALRYFCADILPLIWETLPEARLTIVGARPTAAVRALAKAETRITVTGSVPDVRPFAARDGGVFIVPLRSGSGMRVKILNAMAMGLPVVSTTVGAEGIDVVDGENILLADEPAAFARAVVSLLGDRPRAARIGGAGRALMEARYGWDAVAVDLLRVYAGLLGTGGPPT